MTQFLTSRVSTPTPFKPKHVRNFSEAELEALEMLNTNGNSTPVEKQGNTGFSPITPSKLKESQKVDFDKLEKGAEEAGATNGST